MVTWDYEKKDIKPYVENKTTTKTYTKIPLEEHVNNINLYYISFDNIKIVL